MTDHIGMLFVDNPDLDKYITDFCEKNPEYVKAKGEFYSIAHEIAKAVGFDLYDRFERCFGDYVACSNDIYYLFGLGLRQEVISALQPKVS